MLEAVEMVANKPYNWMLKKVTKITNIHSFSLKLDKKILTK